MLEVGGLFHNSFESAKSRFFFYFWLRAQFAYKMNPIKIYKEWSNLNTVKILFCKVAVPLIKFAIKDEKMTTKKKKKMATIPIVNTL